MKTQQNCRVLFAIVFVTFLSCKDQPSQYGSVTENSNLNQLLLLNPEALNSNANSKNVFEKFLKNNQSKKKNFVTSNIFDFVAESRVPLPESVVEIIVVEKFGNTSTCNLSLFGFIKNGMIAPFFVLNEINQLASNHYEINLKNVNGETFFSYQIKNKKIISHKMINHVMFNMPIFSKLSKVSPGTSKIEGLFAECVQSWGEYMVGGTFQGSVTFIFCLSFGPQCAAMIIGNCLAHQVESWLGW